MSYSVPYYSPEVIAETASKILIETEAVLFNADDPFTYTSGRKGPV